MIRWLASVVVLTGFVCAQAPSSAPALVANNAASGAANPSTVSPDGIAPKYEGTARPVPDQPPLRPGKVTLMGGTIQRVDHLRDRMVLQFFGGGHTTVLFDERTRVVRDGRAASVRDLKNGQRAYVDTTLDGTDVFARNIRVVEPPTGQSNGQIVGFDSARGELLLRDTLSPKPATMHLGGDVVILRGDGAATTSALLPGTLVSLTFTPGSGDTPTVHQISILASPGETFVFSGRVEYLDLNRGLLALVDPRDNKSYNVHFDPAARQWTRDLQQGADVTVQADFDGKRYEARAITVNWAPSK